MSSATIVEPRHLAQENIEQDCSTTKITDTDFLRSKWQITTFSDLMNLLASWGFEREDFTLFHISWLDLDGVVEILEEETRHRREHFDFDIDGMVLKLDDMTLWDELGRTEHHPRYAIAYKFPAKQVRTQVISIEHSVGRTGTVTPVANLEGIEVSGVIVRRATLHNYDELTKKWVREGDYVFIMRAGEVIPEIVSVLTELRDGSEKIVKAPELCPICSTRLEQDEWKVAIYCPNKHCPAKIQGELEMFVWKQGFNIDGLGIKQIELFLELGWITDFVSVFHLSKYREQFLELEGYQEKSVNNLLAAIEQSRHTTLDRVFVALGIPNVGKKTARLIANLLSNNVSVISSETIVESRYPAQSDTEQDFSLRSTSLEMTEQQQRLLSIMFMITEEELLEVKDIWPETARAFVEYMEENSELVERLIGELDIPLPERNPQSLPDSSLAKELIGKSFCITGSFEGISRDQIHELIEQHGGEVRTAVTGKLDYLIIGSNAGSKKSKAESLGVKCIGIDELTLLVP